MKKILPFLTCIWLSLQAFAQDNAYLTHARLSERLQALAGRHSGLATVRSIGKSSGGADLWLLTIAKGDHAAKPAIVLAANLKGPHLAGTHIALRFAEQLLASASTDSISRLLETRTIYILPALNPDAAAQYHAAVRYERGTTARPADDDRDGRLNEDGFEDLNGDGLITQIRIEDETGSFVPHKDDPRVLVKADPTKGEKGKYLLLSEGIDNDKDGHWNEDGEGGVEPDKNFSFDYPFFTPGAGEYAVSEPENQALANFLYDQQNVYAIFVLGPENNLSEPVKFDRSKTTKRIITGPLEKDAAGHELVSKWYQAKTDLKNAPASPLTRGSFAQWSYFHYGKWAFSSPGWWTPKVEAPKDSTKKEAKPAAPANEPEDLKFLRWADQQKLSGVYVGWTPIQHPDFPNKKVEVGGFVPFAKINPPVGLLDDIAARHGKFWLEFVRQMPAVNIDNIRSEDLGGGLTRVTVRCYNAGLLPTSTELSDRIRHIRKVRVQCLTANGQSIISGKKIHLQNSMAGGESFELSWVIQGKGQLRIEAGSPMTGLNTVTVETK